MVTEKFDSQSFQNYIDFASADINTMVPSTLDFYVIQNRGGSLGAMLVSRSQTLFLRRGVIDFSSDNTPAR